MPPVTTDTPATDTPTTGSAAGSGRSVRMLWLVGALAALLLAGFVSNYASASPDGLEKVAADHGIDNKAEEHASGGFPLVGYRAGEVSDPRLSGGLARVIGVGATLAVGTCVFWVVRRRGSGADETEGS